MATTSNILTLLKFYAGKRKSPFVPYDEFGIYLHKYAQLHLEENSSLVIYCSNDYMDSLAGEINQLVVDHQVIISTIKGKEYIYLISYFVEKYTALYKQIETNHSVPFPVLADLPKSVPHSIITRTTGEEIIYRLLDKEVVDDKTLYGIEFSKNLPPLLFPSTIQMSTLLNIALIKIQHHLKKEESHDYFQRKLTISNPGKEISIKTFFKHFTENPIASLDVLKESGETFFYWSQMCYFIKQDYSKLKDLAPEDITALISVAIIELGSSYYKSKAAEKIQKQNALNTLDNAMLNPPYYFNMADIVKFKDSAGIPLLGQYNETELKDHLYDMTQRTVGNEMPSLLIFKVDETEGYYIRKEKVMLLVIRLCNDIRVQIKESISRAWNKIMLEYDSLPEMKDNAAFERRLEQEIRIASPVLYALLTSSFLPVIEFEDNTPGRPMLFRDGRLIPYSELLMLSRHEIYTDTRIKLPFWYTMPVISWILTLIFRKPKPKKKAESKSITKEYIDEKNALEEEKFKRKDEEDSIDTKLTKKRELRKAAAKLEESYVPENSSLDREIEGYLHEWNDRIGKTNFDNLTEDINSLIRDYLRKVIRSLRSESFSQERVRGLAESLVDSPSMMKIKNHASLKRYVELYLIKLVKNLP